MFTAVIALALGAAPGAPVSFEDALALAEKAPRAVAAADAVAKRRDVTSRLSRVDSNPALAIQPGWRTGPRPGGENGNGFELYATLAQNFNVSGYSALRREVLARELEQEEALSHATRHELRLLTARAWLGLWAAQASLAEARRELELADGLAQRVARAGAAGGMTKVDAANARAYRAEAALAVLAGEGEAFEAGVLLNRVLGLDAEAPARAGEQLPELAMPDEAALQNSLARAERAPRVLAAEHLRDTELARANEAVANKGWWMQGGLQAMREGFGDFVLQATIQVTFPLFDRGEREQAPLVAAAAVAEGERRAAAAEAHADRVRVIHELEHTRETLEEIENQLLPAAEDAAAGEQRRMEGGEATAQEWVLTRRAAVAARGRRLRAQADHAYARFQAAELAAAVAGGAP